MNVSALSPKDRVLICGSTGFVGSRPVPELLKKNLRLRLLVRDVARAGNISSGHADVEVCQGDLISGKGMEDALHGIHSAYYLVHSMGGKSIFRNIQHWEASFSIY